MASLHILISGAGVAGPVAAFWLAKAGADVTVIERSPGPIKAGQGVDIEGPCLEIVQKMGIEQSIKARMTGEEGLCFQELDGTTVAHFKTGLTRDIEIMRGDLADIVTDAASQYKNVRFEYGCTIESLRQTNDKIHVKISNCTSEVPFDILIAADGLRSATRSMVLSPTEAKECLKPLDAFISFFSLPRQDADWPNARIWNAPGGRTLIIRPRRKDAELSCGYMGKIGAPQALKDVLATRDRSAQKEALAETFADVQGVEVERLIREMKASDDFYFEQLTQVKLKRWSEGRCVFVGDAGYSPTPLTGEGTHLAIIGSYVLAAEIARSPNDIPRAFEQYEKSLRSYVEGQQQIPLGGYIVNIINPQTAWGIWLLHQVVRFVAWTNVVSWLPIGGPSKLRLPDFPTEEQKF